MSRVKIDDIVKDEITKANAVCAAVMTALRPAESPQALLHAAERSTGANIAWYALRDIDLLKVEANAKNLLQALRYLRVAVTTASFLHRDREADGLGQVRNAIARAYEQATPFGPPVASGDELVTIPIRTRKPAKWRFVDTETGEVWAWNAEAGRFERDEKTVWMDAGASGA